MIHFAPETFETIDTLKSLRQWVKHLGAGKSFCIDSETTGLDMFSDRAVGVALAFEDQGGSIQSGYVPVAHHKGRNLPVGTVLHELADVCADPRIAKVFSNALYDLMIFSQKGQELKIRNVHDTVYMSYAYSGKTRFSHGMDALAWDYFKRKTITFDQVVNRRPGRKDFRDVPIDEATEYAAEDTAVTLAIAKLLQGLLKKENLWDVYARDRKLIPVLHHMKLAGALVNVPELVRLGYEWQAEAAKYQALANKIAGREVNLGSSPQVMEVLRERNIDIPIHFRSKRPTLDAKHIDQLPEDDEFVQAYLDWKEPNKLYSTFATGLPKAVNPKTGLIHTNFNFCGPSTGRAASSDPNLQNIPTRTDEGAKIRGAFIAEHGHDLICADYSQIELRVLAHRANIPQLIQAFHDGLDIHARTASEMFDVPLDDVPKSLRARAKTINFGIVYGISEFGLSRQLKIPVSEAADYIDLYFSRFPGILDYMEEVRAFARWHGYVETMFGRRVYTEDINSNNAKLRGKAERLASNAPIQGTAADVIRMAMVECHAEIEANPKWKAKLSLTVHDELVARAPTKQAGHVKDMLERVMPHAADHLVKWRVPILVEAKVGRTWKEAK